MPVGGGGADRSQPRRLGDGEASGAFFRDQRCRGLDQRLAQVAVVVASPFETALPCPAHVTKLYIRRRPVPSGVAGQAVRGVVLHAAGQVG
jgi:hypothetical protein